MHTVPAAQVAMELVLAQTLPDGHTVDTLDPGGQYVPFLHVAMLLALTQ